MHAESLLTSYGQSVSVPIDSLDEEIQQKGRYNTRYAEYNCNHHLSARKSLRLDGNILGVDGCNW